MTQITSANNPLIKYIVDLHERKHRYQHKQFIAEGIRVCATLIENNYLPVYFFATEEMLTQATNLIQKQDITVVSQNVMKKISPSVTPSGILAVFHFGTKNNFPLTTPGLVLANITDPGNMGTLIRTAAALAVRTVIIVEGTDCWSPKVVQASAGTIGAVNMQQLSWPELMKQKKDIPLSALVVSGGKTPTYDNLHHSLLVIGNEAHGLPLEWQQDCEQLITLPMPGNTESLNAAVAGSIALYLATVQ